MSKLPAIEFVRGDTKIFEVTLQDKILQTPVDITGATVTSQIRDGADGATALATATGSLVDATNGVFRVTYSAASTAALSVGNFKFDIQIEFADGTIRTLWPDRRAKVVGDVTK